ncbi:MAG6790 family protein [Mycoplasma todarodis]|uniref:Uncharacterized protein n=1 Tax=Mycoplasma todarodis TaxID=1937191 RepID=A0A4R0XKB9_9MOLU|nr:hypothetical protein [Mycoplasma todarodis]TCG11096.1 hypothetical protein C4B25_02280 [Mycoplasma todarodis]
MYQYKAVLKSTKEIISQGHTLEDVEKDIKGFRRGHKHGLHTDSNVQVEIYHVLRDQKEGHGKDKLLKVV